MGASSRQRPNGNLNTPALRDRLEGIFLVGPRKAGIVPSPPNVLSGPNGVLTFTHFWLVKPSML